MNNMYAQYVVFVLKDELAKRQEANPRYSSRAFAKHLGVDSSLLAKILSGKRLPTVKVVQQIEKKLGIKLAAAKKSGSNYTELSPKETLLPSYELAAFFHSGWEPYAFWARLRSGTFCGNAGDLAREFAIDESRAKEVFDRLLATGLCKKNDKGFYVAEEVLITNVGLENFSEHHQKLQRLHLEKALEALKTQKERSHFSSMTFRMAPEKLNLAKNISGLFRRQATHLLEGASTSQEQSVYCLQMCIVPMSQVK